MIDRKRFVQSCWWLGVLFNSSRILAPQIEYFVILIKVKICQIVKCIAWLMTIRFIIMITRKEFTLVENWKKIITTRHKICHFFKTTIFLSNLQKSLSCSSYILNWNEFWSINLFCLSYLYFITKNNCIVTFYRILYVSN